MMRSLVVSALACLGIVQSFTESTCSGSGVCDQVQRHQKALEGPSEVVAEAVEYVAGKLMGLSRKERQWVLQNVAGVAGVSVAVADPASASTQRTEDTEGDSKDLDEAAGWQAASCIFAGFVILCGLLVIHFMRVLVGEKARYRKQHIGDQATFKQYLLYRFCYWYTWTQGSAAIVLCTLSLVVMIMGGLLLRVITGDEVSHSIYACWIWIAAPDGGSSAESPGGRFVGALISCAGMLIFALLMSVVSSEVEEMLHTFRAGSVPVIEGDHVVILGWSPLVPMLIQELCLAAKSRGGGTIAILSPMCKLETDEILRESDINRENSIVVVRSGDAASAPDLEKVATASARCVIVLSRPELPREAADARTLNVMLRLKERQWPCHGSCVVQCELVRNKRLFKNIAPGNAEVITIGDSVGELMVQCSRQSGLSSIMTSMLGFEDDEFYIHSVSGVAGMSFGEAVLTMPNVVVVGIVPADGVPQLHPELDRTLLESDQLIMLAEDVSTLPDTFHAANPAAKLSSCGPARQMSSGERVAEHIILFGWNETAGAVIQELDKNVGANSKLIVFGPVSIEMRKEFIEKAQQRRRYQYQNLTVSHVASPLGARFQLEELPLEIADKIIILADSSASSAAEADGDMLALVLQVRDILSERISNPNLVITPQVLDHDTVSVCHNLNVPDFVNSNELAGRILALVCETPKMCSIINGILGADCHICVSDLSCYGMNTDGENKDVCFEQVALAASCVGDIALGWSAEGAGSTGPWELNPKDRKRKRSWLSESRVVALRRESLLPDPGCMETPRRRKRDMVANKVSWGFGSFSKAKPS